MSSVRMQGNIGGTGVITVSSPNTNSDRAIVLPDASGTVNVSGAPNEVPAGSAAAPAIYPAGDTNTGIFFPAADTIAFSEGGVESMRIDASGNLGIGTSPVSLGSGFATIDVAGANGGGMRFRTSGNSAYLLANTSGVDIATLDALPMRFITNSAERARITSAGNVGINTTNPTTRLSVEGGIAYNANSINGFGLNNGGVYTFNNGSVNSIGGGANGGFIVVSISQGNGVTTIPIISNSGGGVAWAMSVFDPDSGTFVYGAGPAVSFTTAGTGGNTYTLGVNGATAAMTIQRTAGSASYTVSVQFICAS